MGGGQQELLLQYYVQVLLTIFFCYCLNSEVTMWMLTYFLISFSNQNK